MSIASMTNVASARTQLPAFTTPREIARATASQTDGRVSNTLQTLTTYIPTEVIALYAAVIGIADLVGGSGTVVGSILFGLFAAATPVAVWAMYRVKSGRNSPLPAFEMTSACVAFVAWAFCMPQGLWHNFSWYEPAIGAALVVAAQSAITVLATALPKGAAGPVLGNNE